MDEDKSADPAAYVDEYNVHQLLKVGRRVKKSVIIPCGWYRQCNRLI